jgi:hypothetical protein
VALVVVVHGNTDPEAARQLEAFRFRAQPELGEAVRALTLQNVGTEIQRGDEVFALFYTSGGHVNHDLRPVLDRAGCRFYGTIPEDLTADFVASVLRQRRVGPERRILLVSVKARTYRAQKAESLNRLVHGLRRHGYRASAAEYDDPETIPRGIAEDPRPVAFLLTLLPGFTLERAPPVLQREGYDVLAEPWLLPMTPLLLPWMKQERSRGAREPFVVPTKHP